MTLYATSCSSSAFCVSVGEVGIPDFDAFPLVETYSGGVWTASIAPTPANANTNELTGGFTSVNVPPLASTTPISLPPNQLLKAHCWTTCPMVPGRQVRVRFLWRDLKG
jgi:hypothetical protein